MTYIEHPFEPIYDKNSRILILGTMPSIKSRQKNFYYAHPQNKFWKVLSIVFKEKMPVTEIQKTEFLLRHHIALWDVLFSCEIENSSDSSIKNPKVNAIELLIKKTKIKVIFTNGKKAYTLYQKYVYPITKIKAISLPSTSPANIGNFSLEELIRHYQIIASYEKNSTE